MKERNVLSLLLSTHSWILDGLRVFVSVTERESTRTPVVAAVYLMHNTDTVQAHVTWTVSSGEPAVCFALTTLVLLCFISCAPCPQGATFDVIQNWLQWLPSMPTVMTLSWCQDIFCTTHSLNLTLNTPICLPCYDYEAKPELGRECYKTANLNTDLGPRLNSSCLLITW